MPQLDSEAESRTAPGNRHLKLRAECSEDLTVLSAILQDAVTVVGDLAYRPQERRFVAMVNRYLWEETVGENGQSGERCHRIRSGLHFDGVLKASFHGFSLRAKKKALELLALHFTPTADGGGRIILLFAGGSAIRLDVECIDGYLSDIGQPWKARCKPCHAKAEALAG